MVESKFRAWFERAQASGDPMSRKDREVPMRSISPRPGWAGDKQPSFWEFAKDSFLPDAIAYSGRFPFQRCRPAPTHRGVSPAPCTVGEGLRQRPRARRAGLLIELGCEAIRRGS
jgi:hypothetical protein